MSQDKALYTNLINSLFPTIHGNEEVKRGVLLMLFGGVAKRTGEGTSLRGDINVCVVGDPSTAKSQLLKQVADFRYRNEIDVIFLLDTAFSPPQNINLN